ncbi:carboxypeptidase-like regulatory domain-containing protein [Saprospira sp. CCB-QB6]|uniref:carboxypeptidase-like regulatory domain-containing protein n=1 Tax=Saprospira sp. CCB-QB6 TaxID=3023936 RepID=UPI00234B8C49|nr:carboxypeptidase-like regulatory domain-containing protein [Saprospira sp. CCB-QB6]WCL81121.1 carboxypeptidase-like regulatory domain-containing protein [Saprospira sp. CCB-QB6]
MKVEIVHDSLALIIYEKTSAEVKTRMKALSMLQNRYFYYKMNENMLLGRAELSFIRPFLEDLNLRTEERAFISKSQEILDREERQNRIRKNAIILMGATLIMTPFAVWGWYNASLAETEAAMAHKKAEEVKKENEVFRKAITKSGNLTIKPLPPEAEGGMAQLEIGYASLFIEGQVTDENGQGLSNAQIFFMGAEVRSDQKGFFKFNLVLHPIDLTKKNIILEVKRKGYRSKEEAIKIEPKLKLDIALKKE